MGEHLLGPTLGLFGATLGTVAMLRRRNNFAAAWAALCASWCFLIVMGWV